MLMMTTRAMMPFMRLALSNVVYVENVVFFDSYYIHINIYIYYYIFHFASLRVIKNYIFAIP